MRTWECRPLDASFADKAIDSCTSAPSALPTPPASLPTLPEGGTTRSLSSMTSPPRDRSSPDPPPASPRRPRSQRASPRAPHSHGVMLSLGWSSRAPSARASSCKLAASNAPLRHSIASGAYRPSSLSRSGVLSMISANV